MDISRRKLFSLIAGDLLSPAALSFLNSSNASSSMMQRLIPSSGENIPVIGMGTWRTFNVGNDPELRANRTAVLKTFFELGGAMVDSSPMYGSAEDVMGWALERLDQTEGLFSATKVWTRGKDQGLKEMAHSQDLWGLKKFDLMQIHNLLDWEKHIESLMAMKEAGQIRYIGITTSHGRRHRDMEHVMKNYPIDFVQLTYNVLDREVEKRLLPLAKDQGQAIIVNRPFQRDALFDHIGNAPLPDWANEIDCQHWSQVLLKFTLSHEAVTCVIPATSKVAHMRENMAAGHGPLPDKALRQNIIKHVENL